MNSDRVQNETKCHEGEREDETEVLDTPHPTESQYSRTGHGHMFGIGSPRSECHI